MNVWRSLAPSTVGGLAKAGVDALQTRQVQDHHVADMAPAGRDHRRPQVERRHHDSRWSPNQSGGFVIPSPRSATLMNPLSARVLEMPDDADDRQRQDHRQVEDASDRSGSPGCSRSSRTARRMPDGRRDEHEEPEPDEVVGDGRPEERVRAAEQLLVVVESDEVLARSSVPTPFQSVNDRPKETTVGPQIRARSRIERDPDHQARGSSLSRRVRRL